MIDEGTKTRERTQRDQLVQSLRAMRGNVADQVTEAFYARHPDWLERFGAAGKQRAHEDAGFHLDFLIGAIESSSVRAFEDYTAWACRLLSSRGMAPRFLAEHLEQIEEAVCQRLGSADSKLVKRFMHAALEVCRRPSGIQDDTDDRSADSATECSVYLQAILNGRREAALTVAREAVRHGRSVSSVYVEVLQEAQYEVGRLWETNRISVAREHMATAISQYVIAQLYPEMERAPAVRGSLVISGVEGELHQLGANMVADVLEADGWDVRFLGTNMPHEGIVQAVAEHRAEVLGISVTMLFNLPAVKRLVLTLEEVLRDRAPAIVLGGAAIRVHGGFAEEIGAHGVATDLIEARSLFQSM